VDCDYDSLSWFARMQGLDLEPERGVRCSACFDMRMEVISPHVTSPHHASPLPYFTLPSLLLSSLPFFSSFLLLSSSQVTAAYANSNGFDFFTTTNATSRWKDEQQVNLSGVRAALLYNNNNRNSRNSSREGEDGKDTGTGTADNNKHLQYWVYNWQGDTMTRRKYEVSVSEKFYKQVVNSLLALLALLALLVLLFPLVLPTTFAASTIAAATACTATSAVV
jgi:predicted adenine nucleotide alpha hydrolase (AANH) superfamily ATPase